MLATLFMCVTMTIGAPRIALIPENNQASAIAATLIQSKLEHVHIIDRRSLNTIQVESVLAGKPLANIGVDYLILVKSAVNPVRSDLVTKIVSGSEQSYEIVTTVEVIQPGSAEIIKTIVTSSLANYMDIDLGERLTWLRVSFLTFGTNASKVFSKELTHVVSELNKIFDPKPEEAEGNLAKGGDG